MADEYKLRLVLPDHIKDNAALMRPWLKRITDLTNGHYTTEKVAKRFVDGVWQCWLVIAPDGQACGLGATEVWKDDSDRQVVSIKMFIGKGLRQWKHLAKQIENWARQGGSHRVQHIARKGYGRLIFADYRITHHEFTKVLSDGRR